MFTKSTMKKTSIILIAMLMCFAIVFAACNTDKPFVPVDMPAEGKVSGNGGIAVTYGDWIYYINGSETDSGATNTYAQVDPRVGSVVRVKASVIEELLVINEKDASSSVKEKEITEKVRANVQTVIPNIYYTGNTTTTSLNGLYIFGGRIYITTPNDALTNGGHKQTDQSVLTSYKLDGSDPIRHYVFTSNNAQIMLNEVDGKVVATYYMDIKKGDSTVHSISSLDVASGKNTVVAEEVENAMFDVEGKAVFYPNKDGAICKLNAGATEAKVVVTNDKPEGKDTSPITYTLKSVSNGYVYYTKKDSNNTTLDEKVLYYATETESNKTALAYIPSKYIGWTNKVVYVKTENNGKLYAVEVASGNGDDHKVLLSADQNDKEITLNKIEGNTLYYTCDSVSYTLDLSNDNATPVAYAKSLSTSATGGLVPDVVDIAGSNDKYVFTLSSGSVSFVKYNAAENTNSTSVKILLTAPEKTED